MHLRVACLAFALFMASPMFSPAVAAEIAPLSTFSDCAHCPPMVVLPTGNYRMGESAGEAALIGRQEPSLPQHEVAIGYPFAIGMYEVTVEEVAAYVAETGATPGGACMIRLAETGKQALKYAGMLHPDSGKASDSPYAVFISDGSFTQPGLPVGPKQPAVCLSRREMSAYLDWLSGKTGRSYRFATEAEWEYAYRAGTDTIAFWGDDFRKTCDFANFGDRKSGYQAGMAATCSEKIHPLWTAEVGSYKPNPWGLYDMAGNVQEMVADCLHDNYAGAPTDGSPWAEQDCLLFVARGGDYELTHYSMRASERLFMGYVEGSGGDDPIWGKDAAWDSRSNIVGFRVAVSLDDRAWDAH